jgi:hypothetical protein
LAASHLSTLDYVGLHETFARDVKEIFRQLGSHGRLAIPMVNASSGTALAQLSEAEMKRVRELTKLDARLYSITLDKRREQQAYERNWKWPWPRLRTLP